jgi:ABC-type multidrug transport system fused ATPase/permease subunit
LDEATSSLDSKNESLVHDAIERAMKGRTVIIIAHRLCTVKNADEILCMKEGKVVEKGTHDELMEMNGVYNDLVSKQLK